MAVSNGILQQKVNYMNKTGEGGKTDWTIDSLNKAITDEGLTQDSWFDTYGKNEPWYASTPESLISQKANSINSTLSDFDQTIADAGLDRNSWFNNYGQNEDWYNSVSSSLLDQKINNLNASNANGKNDWTLDSLDQSIADSGLDRKSWFNDYGQNEAWYNTVSSDTLGDKVRSLNASALDGYGSWDLDALDKAIADAGLDRGSWYNTYGQNEAWNYNNASSYVDQPQEYVLPDGSRGNGVGYDWGSILSGKANAMNEGRTLADGQVAFGWTPESVQSTIDAQGLTMPEWWSKYGQYENIVPDTTSAYTYDLNYTDILKKIEDLFSSKKSVVDMSGAPNLVSSVNTDWTDLRNSAFDTALNYYTQGMDERYAQEQSALETKLISQGLQPGTEAWNRALTEFTDARDKAYQSANDLAYQSGLNEMSSLFNMNLQNAALSNSARQQYYDEQSGLYTLGQNAANNYLAQQLALANYYDQASSQALTMDQAIATFQNTLREQELQEQMYERNLPLNELIALISGTQVTLPTFTQTTTAQAAQQPYYQQSSGNTENWLSALIGGGSSIASAGILSLL